MKPRLLAARFIRYLLTMIPLKRGINPVRAGLYRSMFLDLNESFYASARIGHPGFFARFDLRDRHQFNLYMQGDHEPDTERLFRKLVARKRCIVDIGAYIGTYSLQAAKINPKARIYALEPFPKLRDSIEEGIRLNGFQNIELIQTAVSDNDGEATLVSTDPLGESGWNFVTDKTMEGKDHIKVQTLKLDTILIGLETPPDIIKIDVEGHELHVLRGARKTLSSPGRREIIIEINETCLRNQGSSGKEVHDFLQEIGYKGHVIKKCGKTMPIAEPGDHTKEMNYYYLKED